MFICTKRTIIKSVVLELFHDNEEENTTVTISDNDIINVKFIKDAQVHNVTGKVKKVRDEILIVDTSYNYDSGLTGIPYTAIREIEINNPEVPDTEEPETPDNEEPEVPGDSEEDTEEPGTEDTEETPNPDVPDNEGSIDTESPDVSDTEEEPEVPGDTEESETEVSEEVNKEQQDIINE